MAQISKDDAGYKKGKAAHHCGPVFSDDRNYCRFFIPGVGVYGTCEKVRGQIDPAHGCKLFEKIPRR